MSDKNYIKWLKLMEDTPKGEILRYHYKLLFEVDKYKQVIDKIKEYIETHKASLPMGRDEFTCEMRFSDPVVLANDINKILEEIE